MADYISQMCTGCLTQSARSNGHPRNKSSSNSHRQTCNLQCSTPARAALVVVEINKSPLPMLDDVVPACCLKVPETEFVERCFDARCASSRFLPGNAPPTVLPALTVSARAHALPCLSCAAVARNIVWAFWFGREQRAARFATPGFERSKTMSASGILDFGCVAGTLMLSWRLCPAIGDLSSRC